MIVRNTNLYCVVGTSRGTSPCMIYGKRFRVSPMAFRGVCNGHGTDAEGVRPPRVARALLAVSGIRTELTCESTYNLQGVRRATKQYTLLLSCRRNSDKAKVKPHQRRRRRWRWRRWKRRRSPQNNNSNKQHRSIRARTRQRWTSIIIILRSITITPTRRRTIWKRMTAPRTLRN